MVKTENQQKAIDSASTVTSTVAPQSTETVSPEAIEWQPGKSGNGRTAVVVGGGPAGTLMALYLAQMNWNVSVYERRDTYVQLLGNSGGVNQSRRSYNIVLTDRGLTALRQAGVELPHDKVVVLKGNVRHTNKGTKLSRGFSENVAVNRNVLAQHLFQEGCDRFPQEISYHFGHRLQTVDFEQRVATFDGKQGITTQSFDLLVGADGVFSQVRTAMAETFEGFTCHQNKDNMMFKICQLGQASEFSGAGENWGDCFHVWPSSQPVTILAPPNPDGSITGVLILPQEGEITFDKIQTEEDVVALFAQKFPDLREGKSLPVEFAQDLLTQKPSYGGITTTCSALHGSDRAVLVGDAGHSVWASLGQGCNVALESCRVLAETLSKHDGNLSVALSAYTRDRKPDTDAIGRLSEAGFGGNKRAGNVLFFTKIIALSLLNKLLPRLFAKPAIVNLSKAEIRYSDIEAQSQIQEKQLLAMAIAIASMILILTIAGKIITV